MTQNAKARKLILVSVLVVINSAVVPCFVWSQSMPAAESAAGSNGVAILCAVIADVATNQINRVLSDLPDIKRIALVSDADCGISWPTNCEPHLVGYQFCRIDNDKTILNPFHQMNHVEIPEKRPLMIGLLLDQFEVTPLETRRSLSGKVVVSMFQVGGVRDQSGATIPARTVIYSYHRVGDVCFLKRVGSVSL